ncbi:uncharacterized protein K441DRAFT_539515 [Cenococcum geophilum 1.58]|uniref:uncharacterized protein n=1 Tax=Cenococcum geophilum 1.58 TaxID=794803 RepID=UPI00358FAB22|nr:hypothetical protein K441DRAFT_539515 [Cenococcum geophilum 1.58]
MILVMGVTGAGKSYFINRLAEGTVQEGPGLKSQTQQPQVVKALLGDDTELQTEVAIVDTPGFDDSARPDSEILDEISQFLAVQYLVGIELQGIIYLHRITDNRMQGSAFRYFQMFQRLCGEQAFGNVILLTTMWDQLPDEAVGYRREQELRKDYWDMMEEKGSHIAIFDGSHEMAESIVLRLLGKAKVTLDIQRELVDSNKPLGDTLAGRLVASSVEARLIEIEKLENQLTHRLQGLESTDSQASNLRRERDKAKAEVAAQKQGRNRLKARVGSETKRKVENEDGTTVKKRFDRDKIGMFAALLGLGVNLVFAILPFVGF